MDVLAWPNFVIVVATVFAFVLTPAKKVVVTMYYEIASWS